MSGSHKAEQGRPGRAQIVAQRLRATEPRRGLGQPRGAHWSPGAVRSSSSGRQSCSPRRGPTSHSCLQDMDAYPFIVKGIFHTELHTRDSGSLAASKGGPKSTKRWVSQPASCCIHHNTWTRLSTIIPRCGWDVKPSHRRWAVSEGHV